jgi:N-acetylglucosaminyldiphosphoundecaprenol N-acetyl-beta-D-mannosaminyltransferase
MIANHNLHSIYLYHHCDAMRRYCDRADRIFIDGMALVLLARIVGIPLRREHRFTSVDWLEPLMRLAGANGWRVFLLGSRPGVAAAAGEALRRNVPSFEFDSASGFFDTAPESLENETVLARIDQFRPDILLVGMGMPRQERWILENRDRVSATVIMNLGAIFDYLAGEIPTPPRWMSRLGLEWLGRLIAEPRRLGRRYLVEPWSLLPLLARDLVRRRGSAAGLK